MYSYTISSEPFSCSLLAWCSLVTSPVSRGRSRRLCRQLSLDKSCTDCCTGCCVIDESVATNHSVGLLHVVVTWQRTVTRRVLWLCSVVQVQFTDYSSVFVVAQCHCTFHYSTLRVSEDVTLHWMRRLIFHCLHLCHRLPQTQLLVIRLFHSMTSVTWYVEFSYVFWLMLASTSAFYLLFYNSEHL